MKKAEISAPGAARALALILIEPFSIIFFPWVSWILGGLVILFTAIAIIGMMIMGLKKTLSAGAKPGWSK